jgi:muramoyltetrapeptide carboxypeptidase
MDEAALRAGVQRLTSRGYEVVVAANATSRQGYLAGTDAARLAALDAALEDPAVRALWVARGGYGATRLLDQLPGAKVAARRCPLIGFSDATALLSVWAKAGVPAIHGPHVTELGELPDPALDAVLDLLQGHPPPPLPLSRARVQAGDAGALLRGPLVGGNLAVLGALAGTPHLLPMAGSLLFLEEVNERPYRIDRLLTQLRSARALEGVQAVLVGSLAGCEPPAASGPTALEVIAERFPGVPLVSDLPAGHRVQQTPLLLGVPTELDLSVPELRWV